MRGNNFHFIFALGTASKQQRQRKMGGVLPVKGHTHSRACRLGTSSLDGIIRCSLTKSVLTHSVTDVTLERTGHLKTTGSGWRKSMDVMLLTNSSKKGIRWSNTQPKITVISPKHIEISYQD